MKNKYYANKGVERNKTPLNNIVYEVEVVQLKSDVDKAKYEEYKYQDGYLVLYWWYEGMSTNIKNWHGFITLEEIKTLLDQKQYSKFRQGKRIFIIQRRVDGKNVKKG